MTKKLAYWELNTFEGKVYAIGRPSSHRVELMTGAIVSYSESSQSIILITSEDSYEIVKDNALNHHRVGFSLDQALEPLKRLVRPSQ